MLHSWRQCLMVRSVQVVTVYCWTLSGFLCWFLSQIGVGWGDADICMSYYVLQVSPNLFITGVQWENSLTLWISEGKKKNQLSLFFLVWLYVPEKAPRKIPEERSCMGMLPLIPISLCFTDMEVDLWTDQYKMLFECVIIQSSNRSPGVKTPSLFPCSSIIFTNC